MVNKSFAVFILVNVLAGALAFAQDKESSSVDQSGQPEIVVDECRDVLPQVDSNYQDVTNKIRDAKLSQQTFYDNYLTGFNNMTEVLFRMTQEREEETQKISENRDALKISLTQFNETRTAETTKSVQDNLQNLTVRIYSALMDSQNKLESLRADMAQVDSTHGQFEVSKQDLDNLDHQRFQLESKLINLKIKCQAKN